MLQKFALAFKTKTFEFFADDEEDEYDDLAAAAAAAGGAGGDAPEEIITGQRVVVLKPDPPPRPSPSSLLPSLLATVSSFRAAYLHLQTAHSPLDPSAVSSADRSAVSHLRRLSDLKSSYLGNPSPSPSISSHLQSQVEDNQTLLRTFDSIINRLQSDIDRKDADAEALKQTLRQADHANSKLDRRLERAASFPPDDRIDALLSVSVFDSVLRDSYRAAHHFTRTLISLMKNSGLDLHSAANSIYPDVVYAKPGHCQYAILSYICLGMFELFDSEGFGEGGAGADASDVDTRRTSSLRQFIEHSAVDPLELLNDSPKCGFAVFCDKKYERLISSSRDTALFGDSDQRELMLDFLHSSSSLYEQFVNMASSVWMLHKLAMAYDPVVQIFHVRRGEDYSEVYMERVVQVAASAGLECAKLVRPKVGFTVFPGFQVGKTVIQCRVYLDGS